MTTPGARADRRRHHAHLGDGARPVGRARCVGHRRHRRRHAARAVQGPAEARRRAASTASCSTRAADRCPDPPAADLCIVYPTISFRASDELGNERASATTSRVDNIAPVADLDPPKVRSSGSRTCSLLAGVRSAGAQQQLRGDMPNDATVAPQVFDLRARIEDDGNHAAGPEGGADLAGRSRQDRRLRARRRDARR